MSDPIAERRAEIRRLVQRADDLVGRDWDAATADAWAVLYEALNELDRESGPGLAAGRVLRFQAGDGLVSYIIDRIDTRDPHRVHCVWVPNDDGYEADAVDSDGWCLRSVAEAQIRRREGW